MTSEWILKERIAFFMVTSHAGLIFLTIWFAACGGFTFNQATTTLGLIGPLFVGYTSVIVSFYVRHRHESDHVDSPTVNRGYTVLSWFFPVFLASLLLAAILGYVYGKGIEEFDNFVKAIGIIEGICGIYVGQFIYSMFEGKAIKGGRRQDYSK